jgi:hypothetical protein
MRRNVMEKPYIISAELDLANEELEQVVKREKIDSFRESLDKDLRRMGKETLWVPSGKIQRDLKRVVEKTNLPTVSLDNRYVTNADQYLGISRGTDALLNDSGYVSRAGYLPIEDQLNRVSVLGGEVMLLDDVLFSGEMISQLADNLERYGVRVTKVATGIAIQEGIDKLQAQGIDVVATEIFDDVEDEICERDFAVVPGSGRRVDELSANALYFDNKYGRPKQWASISSLYSRAFCVNSLRRSLCILRPEVAMQSLGAFIGYGTDGLAVQQLQKRLGEEL